MDHIKMAMDPWCQSRSEIHQIELIHEALPEGNLEDVVLNGGFFKGKPLFVCPMTAGHKESEMINLRIAQACQIQGWAMGVGSQRRELLDLNLTNEWQNLRNNFKDVPIMGNLGLSQAISTPLHKIEKLIETLEANAFSIHTNPLQESLQAEGTPQFKGGLDVIKKIAKKISIPLILKETGCGFSRATIKKLIGSGIRALDVSGYGGTHWGRIESLRAPKDSTSSKAKDVFSHWGISTVDSILNGTNLDIDFELWGSGGVRSGVDAAKLFALGVTMVGFAQPILEAALHSTDHIISKMQQIEWELKVALFCTGCFNTNDIRSKKNWRKLTE